VGKDGAFEVTRFEGNSTVYVNLYPSQTVNIATLAFQSEVAEHVVE
jgi:hypothetical protein